MKQATQIKDVFLRYLILVAAALPNLYLFYLIFTPLTIYVIYFLLDLFMDVSLVGNSIIFSGCTSIEIIGACVAGSAYYLLLILNLSVPKIKLKQRIQMIAFAFSSLFLLNIIRILILSLLLVSNSPIFDATHKIFWYALSTIFVVGLWFYEVKLFKIKSIPIYSDLKFLFKLKK